MGFGSYDESEQEQPAIDTREIDPQRVTRTGFEGELGFESGANTDDLLAQLGEIMREKEERA